MALDPSAKPLIAIVGSTGTGKSKLAIELAKRFDGEIVNGDAMQMYKGLPITTNKVSEAERQNIPHWIFDQIGLDEEPWTVQHYRVEAQKVIQEIRSRGRLPILVGGTHYYAEAVLFKNSSVLEGRTNRLLKNQKDEKDKDARQIWPILDAPTSDILARLRDVDPQMASRWHPNDRRKIQRSLEIWLQTGSTASQAYEEQGRQRSEAREGDKKSSIANNGVSVYPSLILWLRANDKTLGTRLDDRVDAMASSGLLSEAQAIASQEHDLTAAGLTLDKTKGIWASIGYKELTPYLTATDDTHREPSTTEDLASIESSCIGSIKAATRQYARRQDRWIRLHLAATLVEADGSTALDTLYPLDCTNPDAPAWESNVYEPATNIISASLGGRARPKPDSLSTMASETMASLRLAVTTKTDNNDTNDDNVSNTSYHYAREVRECRYCQVCNKTMMTDREWNAHLASNTHSKALAGRRKWEKFQAWKAANSTGMGTASRTARDAKDREVAERGERSRGGSQEVVRSIYK